jgi:hypothetical protein
MGTRWNEVERNIVLSCRHLRPRHSAQPPSREHRWSAMLGRGGKNLEQTTPDNVPEIEILRKAQ